MYRVGTCSEPHPSRPCSPDRVIRETQASDEDDGGTAPCAPLPVVGRASVGAAPDEGALSAAELGAGALGAGALSPAGALGAGALSLDGAGCDEPLSDADGPVADGPVDDGPSDPAAGAGGPSPSCRGATVNEAVSASTRPPRRPPS